MMLLEAASNDESAARQVREAMDATGSVTYARATAQRLVDEAKAAAGLLPASEARSMLMAMADAVVAREH